MKQIKLSFFISLLIFIAIISPSFLADRWEEEDFGGEVVVSWSSGFTSGWTISSSHSTTTPGYENGNWSHSEHMSSGSLEELWTFQNDITWSVVDSSSWHNGNYTLNVNVDDPLTNLTFAVLNTSSTNRSQELGWIHSNSTATGIEYNWFIIYCYRNATSWDAVFHQSHAWFLVTFNGTDIFDQFTGLGYEDWNSWDHGDFPEWEYDPHDYDGCYWKLIYNEYTQHIQFKHWQGGLMNERIGWEVDFSPTIPDTTTSSAGHGFGVLDYGGTEIGDTQFDLYNLWQLNSTVNESDTMEINDNVVNRSHMNFNIVNMSLLANDWIYLQAMENESDGGNFSIDLVRTIMKTNITNKFSLESREALPFATEANDQDDNIYYYAALLDDCINFSIDVGVQPPIYDEYLLIWIQACNDGEYDLGGTLPFWDDAIVAIDVDNDGNWDSNDRAYWWWGAVEEGVGGLGYQFNGNTSVFPPLFSGSAWETAWNGTANLHRYDPHVNYMLKIPLSSLVKTNSYPLNSTDTFGLSICTFDEGMDIATVWQNWNETSGVCFYDELTDASVANYFFNFTDCDFPINSTTISRWGEGQIIGDLDASGEIAYQINISSEINDTSSGIGETYALVNVSIWVNNTGAGNLTGIVVNSSWWSCGCSDLNMTIVETNVDESDITWYNDSCYWELSGASIEPLTHGSSWEIWYIVNITNCSGVTQTSEQINSSVNATEISGYDTDTNPQTFTWGITVTQVCVDYSTDLPDIVDIGSTIFNIIGIAFVLGAIFLIMYIIKKNNIGV